MRNRSGISGVASSPVLVGAVTVLVVIVAVFLAYNANNGLPFVSTYDLKARVPNADASVKGNDIRIGGVRVGTVRSVVPVQLENGEYAAELTLRLDKNAEPLPVDSTITVRPKSALGLKFLQITPGDSDEGFEAGETIPVASAKPEPVDIDEFFDMFDEETRSSIRTNFAGFWRSLEALAATVAPVAETQAAMFVALDRTFAAFARVSRPYIQETIEKGPETLDEVNADLPAVRPFLRNSARFFTALRPGVKALAETSPVIADSLHAGIPVLNASPVLNNQLEPTAQALVDFQEAPGVFNGLELLTDTNRLLKPALTYIAPSQTVCNYWSLTFKEISNAASQGNKNGNWLQFVSFAPPEGPNAESTFASAPANEAGDSENHLHFNPYPRTAAPGQGNVCEAGNEKYVEGKTVIGRAPALWGTETRGRDKK